MLTTTFFTTLSALMACAHGLALPPHSKGDATESSHAALQARGVKAPKPADYYSALFVAGASYNDNAHPRDDAYAGSLRDYWPYYQWDGRYTNGKVAVEYLAEMMGVTLLDYAYGGSQIDNSLTYGTSPATKDQINTYLEDVRDGNVDLGSGRVMHYINSGINPLSQIWQEAIDNGLSYQAKQTARSKVDAQVGAIASQLRSINKNDTLFKTAHGSDYLVAGIPPLEILPTFKYQASNDATKLAFLQELSARFNDKLEVFTRRFSTQVTNGGQAFFYDMAALWREFKSNPGKYGLTKGDATCYNSTTGGVCSNPDEYIYFDTLHPVTSIMKIMADDMLAVFQ